MPSCFEINISALLTYSSFLCGLVNNWHNLFIFLNGSTCFERQCWVKSWAVLLLFQVGQTDRRRTSVFEIRAKIFGSLGQKSEWKYFLMLNAVIHRFIFMWLAYIWLWEMHKNILKRHWLFWIHLQFRATWKTLNSLCLS